MIPGLRSRLDGLRAAAWAEPLGIYVHIPFCRDRCTYCSFATTRDQRLRREALDRLAEDITGWGSDLDRPAIDTLYLGGGTPSILSLEELTALTRCVQAAFDLSALQEATLEANPGTVSPEWLRGARRLGWDRISLGLQTLDDALLRRLGRIHDGGEGLTALAWARESGFERISADLMIGIPGQDLPRVREDARRIAAAGARHLSIYMLDLDKSCPLKALVEAGTLTLPSEDETADAFEALLEELPGLGFEAYEISNHAQPGQRSRHNTRYWERRPYLGFGPSAASHLEPLRWTEPEDLGAWLAGNTPPEIQELDALARLAEVPLLGLRMLRGVDWQQLRTAAAEAGLLPKVDAWERELARFIDRGLLVREGPVLRFTREGLLLSNAVLQTFV